MGKALKNIHIGTSGWSYKDWAGIFYPAGLKSKDWLAFYAENFGTVEVNSSFYHKVSPATYENWRAATPEGFLFSVKMSRYLTHIRRLEDAGEIWRNFLEGARGLKEKLGPVLFQLPPYFRASPERLEDLLKISEGYKFVFEFREKSWFSEEIYGILRKYNAALVIADSPAWPSEEVITADFVYYRMHGPGGLYSSRYGREDLGRLAAKIRDLQNLKDIYVYFNNDFAGFAAENAKELIGLLKDGN